MPILSRGCPGPKVWTFTNDANASVTASALSADGTIYHGCSNQKVYSVDGQTGVKKWEYEFLEIMVDPGN